MNEIKLDFKKVWSFEYRGINCEIVNWSFETPIIFSLERFPSGNWNGYIYIKEKQLPGQFIQLLVTKRKTNWGRGYFWNYNKLDNIFNMEGGITYYEVIRDEFNGNKVGIKVGNDYMHSWNDDCIYNEKKIMSDLKKSVDNFIVHFPDYLVWNRVDGSYINPELLK